MGWVVTDSSNYSKRLTRPTSVGEREWGCSQERELLFTKELRQCDHEIATKYDQGIVV